jgi:sulfate permease, SulP family
VLVAVSSLIHVSLLRRLWRVARGEFVVAVSALTGVLFSGLLRGVMIGAIISLVLLLRRAAKPHIAFLGRIPGVRRFSDIARHPDNVLVPGAVLFRVESDMVYFNAEHVHDVVLDHVRATSPLPEIVICDLGTSPYVDLAGADMLDLLHDDLLKLGVKLHLVEAHSEVRDMLRLEGLENKVGRIDRFTSLEDAVDHFLRRQADAA